MAKVNTIKRKNVIRYNNDPCIVNECVIRTPPNLTSFCQMTLRNLVNGKVVHVRCPVSESFDVLPTEQRKVEYSYENQGIYAFMDNDTFELIELNREIIEDAINYLVPGNEYELYYVDGSTPNQIPPPGHRKRGRRRGGGGGQVKHGQKQKHERKKRVMMVVVPFTKGRGKKPNQPGGTGDIWGAQEGRVDRAKGLVGQKRKGVRAGGTSPSQQTITGGSREGGGNARQQGKWVRAHYTRVESAPCKEGGGGGGGGSEGEGRWCI